MAENSRLIFLGSTASVPTPELDSFYMAVEGAKGSVLLVDCGGSPLHRLMKAGIDPLSVRGLLLTHHHPDHLYGLPYLLQGLWLMGRREPFRIWGLPETCEAVSRLLEVWDWSQLGGFAGIECHFVAPEEGVLVLEDEDFEVIAAPVRHLVPTLAFRINSKTSRRGVVYSGDTEPCEGLERLARGAYILIQDSTGPYRGHSSPRQAGEIAHRSGVQKLILAHFNPNADPEEMLAQAREAFKGPVELARDGAIYNF